ncbi:MAG: hypothetical protein ACREE4_10715 [Stellaceae bacterium]
MSALTDPTPSLAAARQRRYRARRKAGVVLIDIECPPKAIARLVQLGWLDPARRGNRAAVEDAVVALLNRALSKGLWPW